MLSLVGGGVGVGVGSGSSHDAAKQANQAGGVASTSGRTGQDLQYLTAGSADPAGGSQRDDLDRTDSLPQSGQWVRMGVITRERVEEALSQSQASRPVRQGSQHTLYSQGSGPNQGSASRREGSQAQGAGSAGRLASSSQSAGRVGLPRQTGANRGAASGSGGPTQSISLVLTDDGRGNAIRGQNVTAGSGGVNPPEERRSNWARLTGSDWFPKRPLAYVFLGISGLTGWWAAEVMKTATVKMQDPGQQRSLLVTQMLAPFMSFAVVMRVYLQMNKEKKQDHKDKMREQEISTIKNRLCQLEAARRPPLE